MLLFRTFRSHASFVAGLVPSGLVGLAVVSGCSDTTDPEPTDTNPLAPSVTATTSDTATTPSAAPTPSGMPSGTNEDGQAGSGIEPAGAGGSMNTGGAMNTGGGMSNGGGENSAGMGGMGDEMGEGGAPAAPSGFLQEGILGVGHYGSCVITSEQTASCWGGNYLLPRSCDNTPDKWGERPCVGRASEPKDLGKVRYLSGNHTAACAILDEEPAKVSCWGPEWNDPPNGGVKDPIQVSGGDRWACVLGAAGDVVCWGRGPANPPNGLVASAIAGSNNLKCAIKKEDSSVVCWGGNANPPADLRAKRITAGGGHACAIAMDDSVVCWGGGGGAQAPAGLKASAIAAGDGSSCAITLGSGEARCWGGGDAPPAGKFVNVGMARRAAILIQEDGTIVQFRNYGKNKFKPMADVKAIAR